MNRFALNGATTGPADLLTDLRVAAAAGFGALELRDTKLEAYLAGGGTLEALAEAFRAAGVRPLSVNALERATLVTGAARRAVLGRCATLCAWAAALGAPYVVAVPGPRAEAAGVGEVAPLTVEMLRALAAVAAEHGVQLAFEFLGPATSSVRTLAEARAIVEAVGDPPVGLVLDAFHFYVGGSTLEMLDGLDPGRLAIVHLDDAEDRPRERLEDAHRLLPGEGVIPLRPLVARLEALGYRGDYSVELFRPAYWAWDPLRLARAARASLETLFAGLGPGAAGHRQGGEAVS